MYLFIQMEGAAQKVLGLYKVFPQHNIQLQQQNSTNTSRNTPD